MHPLFCLNCQRRWVVRGDCGAGRGKLIRARGCGCEQHRRRAEAAEVARARAGAEAEAAAEARQGVELAEALGATVSARERCAVLETQRVEAEEQAAQAVASVRAEAEALEKRLRDDAARQAAELEGARAQAVAAEERAVALEVAHATLRADAERARAEAASISRRCSAQSARLGEEVLAARQAANEGHRVLREAERAGAEECERARAKVGRLQAELAEHEAAAAEDTVSDVSREVVRSLLRHCRSQLSAEAAASIKESIEVREISHAQLPKSARPPDTSASARAVSLRSMAPQRRRCVCSRAGSAQRALGLGHWLACWRRCSRFVSGRALLLLWGTFPLGRMQS